MEDQRIRIIYHPAPGPTAAGEISTPEPVVLGRDVRFALGWIRRRLGLGTPSRGARQHPPYIASAEEPGQ
jgi:hypothetical protein